MMNSWFRWFRIEGGSLPETTQQQPQQSPNAVNQDDLDRAAMHALWPLPLADTLYPPSEDKLQRLEAQRVQLQGWLNGQDFDPPTKRAYQRWLDHCERQNREALVERQTGAKAKAHEETMQRWREEEDRARAIKLPKPSR